MRLWGRYNDRFVRISRLMPRYTSKQLSNQYGFYLKYIIFFTYELFNILFFFKKNNLVGEIISIQNVSKTFCLSIYLFIFFQYIDLVYISM